MKRIIVLLLLSALLPTLASCGAAPANDDMAANTLPGNTEAVAISSGGPVTETDTPADEQREGSNILVAYFSWADNAILAEDVDAVSSPNLIAPGNVQQLAGWIQEETGGDLFSIRVTEPYPSDWDECLSRANEERGEDARPELVENVGDLWRYDTVFLGYPNWWYGVPMALLSFLETHDLSGKQVYLFCSHGTGGLSNSVSLINEAAPDALISDDIFDCYEEDAAGSREDVVDWIQHLGLYNVDDAVSTIIVAFGEDSIVYELNGSLAALSLLEQLPLTVQVEDYGGNEKIFYPPVELDTADTPTASGSAGTLAYYAPWGDVVMFYGSYSENPSLYELGQAVSGSEFISRLEGSATISCVE